MNEARHLTPPLDVSQFGKIYKHDANEEADADVSSQQKTVPFNTERLIRGLNCVYTCHFNVDYGALTLEIIINRLFAAKH